MREYTVTQFKAHALAILTAISRSGEDVIVTKRGKPLAKVSRFSGERPQPKAGHLRAATRIAGDIVAPIDEPWEAAEASR